MSSDDYGLIDNLKSSRYHMATMSLTKKDILHVSKLANITLTEKEVVLLSSQLSTIVTHIDELSEVETDNVGPTSHISGISNIVRMDELTPFDTLTSEEALSNSKDHNGFFVADYVFSSED